MELLWGTGAARKRGPRPRLTIEQLTRAAVDIADAEGLAALSMRRVAEQLGMRTMSVYTYVPGKAELIDLMVDAVLGETIDGEPATAGWRPALERIARRNRALYVRHPWLLQVVTVRPAMGPNLIAKYDHELRAVAELGLDEIEMDLVVALVTDYVYGAARSAVEAAQVRQRSGQSDETWWSINGPLVERVFDPARYPLAARVGPLAGAEYGAAVDPERAFDFGLERVLDGLATLIEERGGQTGARPSPG